MITIAQLSDWLDSTADFEADPPGPYARTVIDRMADEIAIQMPSPGEVNLMDMSPQAKDLYRRLLHSVQERAQTEEEAREFIREVVGALRS